MTRLSIAVVLLCNIMGCAALSPTAPGPYIDALGARVTGIRFFEKGPGDPPPRAQRAYGTRFDEFTARYIAVELELKYIAPGRVVEVPLSCLYLNPDGTRKGEPKWTARVQRDWTTSYHSRGWGRETPGSWTPGTYQVECSAEGRVIAKGAFEVALQASASRRPADVSSPPSTAFDDGMAAFSREDYAGALRVWLPLAQQGHAPAQFRVGTLYEAGLGVAQDLAEAQRWFERAATTFPLGIERDDAVKARDRVAQLLTSSQAPALPPEPPPVPPSAPPWRERPCPPPSPAWR